MDMTTTVTSDKAFMRAVCSRMGCRYPPKIEKPFIHNFNMCCLTSERGVYILFCASQCDKMYILWNLCIMTSLGSAGDYYTVSYEVVEEGESNFTGLYWQALVSGS